MKEEKIEPIEVIFAVLAGFFSLAGAVMCFLKNLSLATISWAAAGLSLWILVFYQNTTIKKSSTD